VLTSTIVEAAFGLGADHLGFKGIEAAAESDDHEPLISSTTTDTRRAA
jgi:hypothetical protein